VLVKIREQETNCRRTYQELGNAERQNPLMSVTVCRRSSAQDFLRDADFAGPIISLLVARAAGPQQRMVGPANSGSPTAIHHRGT
jgi:hypothetical protein